MSKQLHMGYFPIILLFAVSCNSIKKPATQATYVHLDSLFRQHQYFKLQDGFDAQKEKLPQMNQLVLKARLNAVFNKRANSNRTIVTIFSQYREALPDSIRINLLETKSQNSVFLFEYQKALKATQQLLSYDSLLTPEQREDYQNNRIIYDVLKNTSKQTIELRESTLPITKDAAGLSRIPIVINSAKQPAVFDTGANFSVITDSLVTQYGLDVCEGSFKVNALTGKEVDAKIAVVDSLKLGNTRLRNVVFLVVPKQSLSFPQIHYSISAIIGFPIMNALKEVQIINGNQLHIPRKSTPNDVQNLALDFLTPVVEVVQKKTPLLFTFDTGAATTQLYKKYYDLHKQEIQRTGVKDSVGIGGAGGTTTTSIYKIPFSGAIAYKSFQVDTVTVFDHNDIKENNGLAGNLGQDVFSQFDTLTINFEHMFLKLK